MNRYLLAISLAPYAATGTALAQPRQEPPPAATSQATTTERVGVASVDPPGSARTRAGQIEADEAAGFSLPQGMRRLSDPGERIETRLQSRISNRIRNRIDAQYDPRANALDPFATAERNLRRDGVRPPAAEPLPPE